MPPAGLGPENSTHVAQTLTPLTKWEGEIGRPFLQPRNKTAVEISTKKRPSHFLTASKTNGRPEVPGFLKS